jgi:hypothetical protein
MNIDEFLRERSDCIVLVNNYEEAKQKVANQTQIAKWTVELWGGTKMEFLDRERYDVVSDFIVENGDGMVLYFNGKRIEFMTFPLVALPFNAFEMRSDGSATDDWWVIKFTAYKFCRRLHNEFIFKIGKLTNDMGADISGGTLWF